MKDIQSLYAAAKASRKQEDIRAYEEAVQCTMSDHPQDYISNLSYIISSSIGASTLKPFIEKWGLPICMYDELHAMMEKTIEQANRTCSNSDVFQDSMTYLESWHDSHKELFDMYAYLKEDGFDASKYNHAYYYVSKSGVPGRKLMVGMLQNFGPVAIPDILSTASSMGESTSVQALQYLLEQHTPISGTGTAQWIYEYAQHANIGTAYLEQVESRTLQHQVDEMDRRNHQFLRESALLGESSVEGGYTESDVKQIKDLIALREYQILCEGADTTKIQQEIYQMYSMLDGYVTESGDPVAEGVADSVMGMLPQAKMEGFRAVVNTRDKRTGEMPAYLANNHDMGYGENDKPASDSKDSHDSSDHPTDLSDFKRPSAEPQEDPKPDTDEEEEETPAKEEPTTGGGTTNYYYYTYNNSLNKNAHSFNRDSSQHDDHSITKKSDRHDQVIDHSRHDDHSITRKQDSHDTDVNKSQRDDHSTHTDSHDTDTDKSKHDDHSSKKMYPKADDDDSVDESGGSSNPFDLDIFRKPEPFLEAALRKGADWEHECDAFQKMFHHDLNQLGDIENPDKTITFTIGGKSMRFSSSTGNSTHSGKKIERYADLPTAIHQFNVNRQYLTDNNPNIEKAIVHTCRLRDPSRDVENVSEAIRKYNIRANKIIFKPGGEIGLTFQCDFENEHRFGINIRTDLSVEDGEEKVATESTSFVYQEDANDGRPQGDHPVRDALMDLDRKSVKYQQAAKKKVQGIQQAGRAAMKPINRTKQWVQKLVYDWKDADETKAKERLADPRTRSNLFSAVTWSIKTGALFKAGLLLNPVFLVLGVNRALGKNKKEQRLRNEMLIEIKNELDILQEKIHDAERQNKTAEKYKLMRFRNQLNQKYLRVADTTKFGKIV